MAAGQPVCGAVLRCLWYGIKVSVAVSKCLWRYQGVCGGIKVSVARYQELQVYSPDTAFPQDCLDGSAVSCPPREQETTRGGGWGGDGGEGGG